MSIPLNHCRSPNYFRGFLRHEHALRMIDSALFLEGAATTKSSTCHKKQQVSLLIVPVQRHGSCVVALQFSILSIPCILVAHKRGDSRWSYSAYFTGRTCPWGMSGLPCAFHQSRKWASILTQNGSRGGEPSANESKASDLYTSRFLMAAITEKSRDLGCSNAAAYV